MSDTLKYYYLDNCRVPAGSEAKELELSEISKFAQGKKKEDLPAILVTKKRNVWCPSSVFFIDIDTTEGVDTIINGRDQLFNKCGFIRSVQKSASGKLHIIMVGNFYNTVEEWSEEYRILLAWFLYVVEKLFGIDYYNMVDNNGNCVVDLHNAKWDQLLYVSANEVYNAPDQGSLFLGKLSDENDDLLKTTYSKIFESNSKIKNNKSSNVKKSEISNAANVNKLCGMSPTWADIPRIKVDRNFKIGSVSGNELRCCLFSVANTFFSDINDAKNWCDKYFYYDRNKSIWQNYTYAIYDDVQQWLVVNNYIKVPIVNDNKCDYVLKKDQYLSNIYYSVIKQVIDDNHICEIISPTGTGKTRLITSELARDYNAIVICPYNATNGLYKNEGMTVLDSENKDDHNGIINSGKSFTIIYDQFIKYADKFKDRVLIIDEAHLLYFDESFRNSVTIFKNCIKICNNKLILLTATKAKEAEEFNAKLLKIDKEGRPQPIISLLYDIDRENPNKRPNVLNEELSLLKRKNGSILNGYDHIVFFDDRNARILAEKLKEEYESEFGENCVCVLRAENKNKQEFKQVIENELITSKFVVCTRAAFQGLNIKNTDKIYCVFHFEFASSALQDIPQCFGRFRNVCVNGKVIVSFPKVKDLKTYYDFEDKFNDMMKNAKLNECVIDNDINKDAVIDIQEYNGNIKASDIIETIGQITPYLFNEDFSNKSQKRFKSEEEEKMLKNFIESLNCENKEPFAKVYDTAYEINLCDITMNLCFETKMLPIDIYNIWNNQGFTKKYENMVNEILDIYKSTINCSEERLKEIYEMCGHTLKDLKEAKKNMIRGSEEWGFNDFAISKLNERYKKYKKCNKLKKMFQISNNDISYRETICEFFGENKKQKVTENLQNYDDWTTEHKQKFHSEGGKVGGKIGGKIGSPKKKVMFLKTKKIYNSKTEMCKDLGHNISWSSKNKDLWIEINGETNMENCEENIMENSEKMILETLLERRFAEYEDLFS